MPCISTSGGDRRLASEYSNAPASALKQSRVVVTDAQAIKRGLRVLRSLREDSFAVRGAPPLFRQRQHGIARRRHQRPESHARSVRPA